MNIMKTKISFMMLAILSITLVGLAMFVPINSETEYSDGANDDLATMLDNAKDGDTVTMTSDMTLSRDASVYYKTFFVNSGYKLTIPHGVTLVVYGDLTSNGSIDIGGTLKIASGGKGYIDGNINVIGLLEISEDNTTFSVAMKGNTSISGIGEMIIDGTATIGYSSRYIADIEMRTVALGGKISVDYSSNFTVIGYLTVGKPSTTIDDISRVSITGQISLGNDAYVIAYGNPGDRGFTADDIKTPTFSTTFSVMDKIYMVEYISKVGKRTITLPSTDGLKDYIVLDWFNSDQNIVSKDNNIRIGTDKYIEIKGASQRKLYNITFEESESIRWLVDGTSIGSSGVLEKPYNTNIKVDIRPMPGYTEVPPIKANGVNYQPGTQFLVLDHSSFTITTPAPEKGIDMLTIAVIISILAVALLVAAIFLTKGNSKKK